MNEQDHKQDQLDETATPSLADLETPNAEEIKGGVKELTGTLILANNDADTAAGVSPGGRTPGKININMVWTGR